MNDFLNALVQISILVSVMICVVILIKALFAKMMKPVVMSTLWMMILLRLCIPFTIESPIRYKSDIAPMPNVVSMIMENDTQVDVQPINNQSAQNNSTDDISTSDENASPVFNVTALLGERTIFQIVIDYIRDMSLATIVFNVWCAGVVFMLVKSLIITLKFRLRIHCCRQVDDKDVINMVMKQAHNLKITKPIKVVECNHVDVPMVFGYFKPYLLVPSKYLSNNKDNLYYIVLHEMCHIIRHDILKNYLWLAAKIIHWFNPLVYVSYKMYQDNIELCCDKMVVDRLNSDDKYRYSQTLVDVLRMSNSKKMLPVAASFCSSKSMLKERVMIMIQPRKRSRTALVISLVLALVMIVGGFTTACMPEKVEVPIHKVDKVEQPIKEPVKVEKTSSEDDINTEEEPEKETSKFLAPDVWIEELSGDDDIVDMYIDASVDMGNKAHNLIEIKPMEVSQEHIDKFLKSVIYETPIYLDVDKNKSNVLSEIELLNEKLASIQDSEIKKLYDEQLRVRQQVLEDNASDINIPFNTRLDELGYVELDKLDEFIGSDKPLHEVYSITVQNIGLVDAGKEKPAIVKLDKIKGNIIYDNIDMDNISVSHYSPSTKYLKSKDSNFNAELNVINMCENLGYSKNGLGYYVNIDDNGKIYYYKIAYKHLGNGVNPDLFWHFDTTLQYWLKANRDNPVWPMNDAVFISDKNEIQYAEVFAPNAEVVCLDKKVALKDFFEIMDIFKDTIMQSDFMSTIQINIGKELYIDGIQFSYMYMHGDQYDGQILVVPVWHFYGQVANSEDELYKPKTRYLDEFTRRICTINAIDGTVISAKK